MKALCLGRTGYVIPVMGESAGKLTMGTLHSTPGGGKTYARHMLALLSDQISL